MGRPVRDKGRKKGKKKNWDGRKTSCGDIETWARGVTKGALCSHDPIRKVVHEFDDKDRTRPMLLPSSHTPAVPALDTHLT